MTARTKPPLLFLSQVLPYPPDRGVTIRTHHLLRLLSTRFDTRLLCFYRKNAHEHRSVEECLSSVPGTTRASAHPIPQEHSKIRFAWDHTRSLMTRRPYTHFLYDSPEFSDMLEQFLTDVDFRAIHVDTLDLSRFFPKLPGIPVVCGHHNIESDLLRRRSRHQSHPLKAAYMRLQARFQEQELRRWGPRVDMNLIVSENDQSRLAQLAPDACSTVIPNGVDVEHFKPAENEHQADGIVFVGGTTWEPNRDALAFFHSDILPRVRRHSGDVTVKWVGRSRAQERRRYADERGFQLTGYVDDIRPYVHGAACYVVPLRMGGGTRLKILDAWAMGKAVVSTSIGCEGLEARDGVNILVRDDPEAFADAVARVLADPELRRTIGHRARDTAEKTYSWDAIGEDLLQVYDDLHY